MTSALTTTVARRADGTPVLAVSGEIDMSNAPVLQAALSEVLDKAHPVLVDLTEVEYLDSAGLFVLLTNAERIQVTAGNLLESVLRVSGLTELTTVSIVADEPGGGDSPPDPQDRRSHRSADSPVIG